MLSDNGSLIKHLYMKSREINHERQTTTQKSHFEDLIVQRPTLH